MDADDFGTIDGQAVTPIAIPALPLLLFPSNDKPAEPGDCFGSGLQRSFAKLDAASHAVRVKQAALEQQDKQTARTYSLAVSSYEKWWGHYQMQLHAEDPLWTTIPAFPITVAKAVMFLEYETTRPKVSSLCIVLIQPLNPSFMQCKRGSNDIVPNSTVGQQVISQKISALENWRLNHHHLYKDDPEAQISLRLDNRIRRIESAAKHNEPKWTASSQALKAAGTSSGEWLKYCDCL
jgi:hypothetical protein